MFRVHAGKMFKDKRWLMLVPLLLMLWGQFSYACETMDMPPQAVCCCDDGMAGCDTAVPSSQDGCDSGTSSAPCCVVEYQSTAEDVAPASSNTDPPTTWLYTIAAVHGSYPGPLSALSPASSPPDPDWLLAQAESGRTVYLSTLRLRI